MLQPPTLRTNVSSLIGSSSNNHVLVSGSSSSVVGVGVVGSIPPPPPHCSSSSDVATTSPQEDLEDLIAHHHHHYHQQKGRTLLKENDEVIEMKETSSPDVSFLYNSGGSAGGSTTRMTETRKVFLFQVSTIIGTFVFFVFYHFLYQFIYVEDESTKSSLCWLLSYSLSIWCQHELHCRIVFGKRSNSEYWQSLIRTYFVYGISMVFSTIMNYVLVGYFKVGHTHAWIMSLLVVGILNYFTASKFAFADSVEESL